MKSPELQSMTGFATASSSVGDWKINIDIRSVNGKGLDIRLRLPNGLERLEAEAKKRIAAHIGRGNLQVTITMEAGTKKLSAIIDEQAFKAISKQAVAFAKTCGLEPPSADGVLAVRGVVLVDEAQAPVMNDALEAAILNLIDEASNQLAAMRQVEGQALGAILSGQLDDIQKAVEHAATDQANAPENIAIRLRAQISALLDGVGDTGLSEERLHAEAAMLATKADICEEIDRMNAHIIAARALLFGGGTVGRKLDFLCQEFNRETNTICSKSASATLTATGLELKAVIDQFREQVQNLQ